MRRAFLGVSLAIALWLPGQALAWNHKAHMVVAYIAYQALTPDERVLVFQTLETHPDFVTLSRLAGSPQGRNYRMLLFLHAARWPDLVRDDPRFYDETDPHSHPTRHLKSFPDMKRHKSWHFKDQGFTTDGTTFGEPDPINAEVAIDAFRRALTVPGGATPATGYALSWLEHLVGDVHQPLHCISRFTHAHPRGDRGGNLLPITPFPIAGIAVAPDNLHSFWDDVLGGETTLAAVRAAAREAEASSPIEPLADRDTATWIRESFEYARTAAYQPLDGRPEQPRITAGYFQNARRLALKRLKLAGHRLAAVLKESLK